MHADLVGASGFDGNFQQRIRAGYARDVGAHFADGTHFYQRKRRHSIGIIGGRYAHTPFAAFEQKFMQRAIQHALVRRPLPQHEGEIHFSRLAFAELVLQIFQRAAFFRHQQNPAGFAVKAMHQFQKLRFGTRDTQLFNHAKTHARTAMHRHTSGFIQRDEVVVFKQNRKIPRGNRVLRCHRRHGLRFFRCTLRGTDGRNTHHIACIHARIGMGAAFVDAHFATANNAVNMRFRHAFELAHEVVIQALSGIIFANGKGLDLQGFCGWRCPWCRGIDPYNVIHWWCVVSG